MRQAIWKYEVPVGDNATVTMPKGAALLRVACNRTTTGSVLLWARVDPDAPKVKRRILIAGTGHEPEWMRQDHPYLGTAVGSILVWHLFDGGEEERDDAEGA